MQFEHVDVARIEREWPVIAEILAPAIRPDPTQTIEGVHARLARGADGLLEITGPGSALMVIEAAAGGACWVKYLAGRIEGGPKARVAVIREAVSRIEAVALDAGCTEIKICGRDWAVILRDYEPFDGHRNGIRKGL